MRKHGCLVLLLYVPDKSSDAVLLVHVVKFFYVLEHQRHYVVIYNCYYRAVHLGPSVARHARLASVRAASVDEGELCEARYPQLLEYVFQTFRKGLVVCYEYCFHSCAFCATLVLRPL